MKQFNESLTASNMRRFFLALLLTGGVAGLAACDMNEGTAEEAGEEIEQAAEEAGDKMEEAKKEIEESFQQQGTN